MANLENFSKRLRRETRNVHKISDALVNTKFFFALSDNSVWADGLLVFYEIFRFLETNMSEELLPKEFHRTSALERDLEFYLGENWKHDYEMRNSVKIYLKHLYDVKKRSPTLLLAYVYHIYMGLLSGGQILQKKRLLNPLNHGCNKRGEAVTSFDGYTIAELKTKLRNIFDTKAKDFDESIKTLLIAESKMVFHLNNELVRSVRGMSRVNLRK
ncbi:heme oxygenase 1, partial [Contarinia nasturtii]|uniref:heme oxygenase 1 n=1 Tax=Contarinia nasturtii TaxID=265458 RepID=UPI0012D3FABC